MTEDKKTSRAKRASNDKWDAANTRKTTIKLTTTLDADFRAVCERAGVTPYSALVAYVRRCVDAGELL